MTETIEHSKQWYLLIERAPKKSKTVFSDGKVIVTVFWYSQGVIYIDYLEKGKTITGDYYADILDNGPM